MSIEASHGAPLDAAVVADELLSRRTNPIGEAMARELLPSSNYVYSSDPDYDIRAFYAEIAVDLPNPTNDYTDPQERFDAYIKGLATASALTGKPIHNDGFESGPEYDMETRFDSTLAQSFNYLEQSDLAYSIVNDVFAFSEQNQYAYQRLLGLQMGLVLAAHTEIENRRLSAAVMEKLAAQAIYKAAHGNTPVYRSDDEDALRL